MILFSDPADCAVMGTNNTYPTSWWMPDTGTQRGTLNIVKGDFPTQGFPAIGWSFFYKFVYFQATFAEDYGAVGLILFSDPADCVRGMNGTYPNNWWMPETGVPRGPLKMIKGDMQTDGFPSIGW